MGRGRTFGIDRSDWPAGLDWSWASLCGLPVIVGLCAGGLAMAGAWVLGEQFRWISDSYLFMAVPPALLSSLMLIGRESL